jgi:hypothetical protein
VERFRRNCARRAKSRGLVILDILWDPSSLDKEKDLRETQGAAQALGVQTRPLEVRGPESFDNFSEIVVKERMYHLNPAG